MTDDEYDALRGKALMKLIEHGRAVGEEGYTSQAATGEPFEAIALGFRLDDGGSGPAKSLKEADDLLEMAIAMYVDAHWGKGKTVYWRRWPEFETSEERPRIRQVYLRLLVSDKPVLPLPPA